MQKQTVINLDSLKAPSKKIIFLETEFEIGYIPCGRSIPLLEKFNAQLAKQKDTELDPQEILSDNIDMVAFFCEEKLSREHIEENATKEQVEAFYSAVVQAIVENYLPVLQQELSIGAEESDSEKKKAALPTL